MPINETDETGTYRIERFHLSADKLCVVMPHPQAESKFALEQGTIVIRFEAWTTESFRQDIVAFLNRSQYIPPDVSQASLDAWQARRDGKPAAEEVIQPAGTLARAYVSKASSPE